MKKQSNNLERWMKTLAGTGLFLYLALLLSSCSLNPPGLVVDYKYIVKQPPDLYTQVTPEPEVTAERYPEGISTPVLAEIIEGYKKALKECNSDKTAISEFYEQDPSHSGSIPPNKP